MKKRILSTLLAVCFIVMLMPGFASAATFTDMPNDYSTTALEAAVANGLLNGSDGKISPNDNLTRAQMATIISRAFGVTEQASLATYNDVSQSDWFYSDMGKAVKMKVLNGSNGLLNPNSAVTRQEVFTVLARALKLKDGSSADLTTYADKAAVASWALGATAAMISGGYVHGANGVINPAANISRKDFAVLMNNIVKNYIKTAGVVTEIKDGSVMINVPGVTLKNVTVKGNLIIGDGVGNGEVTLDNVKVEGNTIVRGGGVNSFIIKGNSSLGTVTIAKVDGNIRIFVDGSAVEVVEINDGKDDVLVEGNIAKLVINASDVPVSVQHATIKELTVSASGVDLSIAKDSKVTSLLAEGANAKLTVSGTVDTLTASKSAEGTKIEVAKDASVVTVNAAAPKMEITGEGSVKSANVTGNGVKVDTTGTQLTVGSGVTGTTSGGKGVEGGTSTKTEEQSNSGGSVGGGVPPITPIVVSNISASAPKYDGKGTGATNIGNYNVGAVSGTSPNYACAITTTKTLVDVESANAAQGTAKWVGVLITTNKDVTSLAVKTPSMTAFTNLTQADVDEAVAAGATGTKTFIWWLKAENIGTGKDIQIKVRSEQDSTAVKLKVSLVSTVTQDPSKTGGTGATFDAATITFGGAFDYYPADVSLGRTEGNRVGVQITAPSCVTVDKDNATFKYTNSMGEEKTLVNKADKWMDGDNFVYYYPLVTKANDIFTVVIDWDGTGIAYAPEAITIHVVNAKLVVPVGTVMLHDTTASGIYDADLVSAYTATALKGDKDYVEVTVKATDLQYHRNGANKMGFWIGFSVHAPKDAAKLKYAFCAKQEDTATLSNAVDLETVDASGNKGISFYTDLAAETPKTWCKVQWLDASGNNLGSAVTYNMDLSQVTLKVSGSKFFSGNVTLNNLTVAKNATLIVVTGANLVVNKTLTNNGNIYNAGNVSFKNNGSMTLGNFSQLTVTSGANLVVNNNAKVTVASSANLIVNACGKVDATDGDIIYDHGMSTVYCAAAYTDKNVSFGYKNANFLLRTYGDFALVGDYTVTSGAKSYSYTGILLNNSGVVNKDYTVDAGKTLTICTNKTLTIPSGKTLSVKGTVLNAGTLVDNGTFLLDTNGQLLGNTLLKDLKNNISSGIKKTGDKTFAIALSGTNIASGVPTDVQDLFFNAASAIKTQADLDAGLENQKHTAIALDFNLLSKYVVSIDPNKYYRFVQVNDALKPYVDPVDSRVTYDDVNKVYVKNPTTGWKGSDMLNNDFYAMLVLSGKIAGIEIYEGATADSCTNKVATIAIGNNITFA